VRVLTMTDEEYQQIERQLHGRLGHQEDLGFSGSGAKHALGILARAVGPAEGAVRLLRLPGDGAPPRRTTARLTRRRRAGRGDGRTRVRRRTFDAPSFARAWLAVSVAKSNDDYRPLLTAVCLSEYPDGIALAATDSYMAAWCGLGAADPLATPTAEYPIDDSHGHLARLCRDMVKKTAEAETVTLWISATSAVVRYGPHRLVLPLVKGVYPNWRTIVTGHPVAPTSDVVGFNPEFLGRIVKLAKLVRPHSSKPLEVALHGLKPGRFAVSRGTSVSTPS
jgi:hypothetical protein